MYATGDARAPEPLQNRVDPFGRLQKHHARGLLMGNRGGRFHSEDKSLGSRRHISKRWIACLCDFRDRRRNVWGRGYTELFFFDEVTALAAGHRPCFECRPADARKFLELFPGANRAADMDDVLHRERLNGPNKMLHRVPIDALPDGAMVAEMDACFAVRGAMLLHWSFEGYGTPLRRPDGIANVLTPPSILEVLRKGYAPLWGSNRSN